MFFVFGCAFEIPLLIFLGVKLGWLDKQKIKRVRPYVIISAFILGMLLTPPDVGSQCLVAIPLWLLFEVGVWLSR